MAEVRKNSGTHQRINPNDPRYEIAEQLRQLEAGQKKVERLVLASVVSVILIITIAVLVSTDSIESGKDIAKKYFGASGSGDHNPITACQDPRNQNLPYCVDRAQQLQRDWSELTRNPGGAAPPFVLHGSN